MSIKTVSGALDVLNTKVGGTAGDTPADATKVDALKKLYETLGGEASKVKDISTTSEMVEALADVVQGGGGSGGTWATAKVTLTRTTAPATYYVFGNIVEATPLGMRGYSFKKITATEETVMVAYNPNVQSGALLSAALDCTFIPQDNTADVTNATPSTIKFTGDVARVNVGGTSA